MRRAGLDQRPHGGLAVEHRREPEVGKARFDPRHERRQHRLADVEAERPHQTIVHALGARSPAPRSGQTLELHEPGVVRVFQRLLQQLLPPRQEQRPVVELDRESVGRSEVIAGKEVVADLFRARPVVVAAVAQQRQPGIRRRPVVGSPQPAARRVLDAGEPLRRREPDPAGSRPRPVGGKRRVEARAQRQGVPGHGPADVALGVADDEVLRRHPDGRGDRQRLVHAARRLEPGEVEVVGARQVRDPCQRQRDAVDVAAHDRAPDRLLDAERARRAALHANRLEMRLDLRPALGDPVARRIARVAHDAHPVQPIAVAVGEAPRDGAVRAGHEFRQAGQADSVEVDRPAGGLGVRIAQPHAEPDVRHAQAKMHVVRDDGASAGERAPDGEVVAARPSLGRHGGGWRGGPYCAQVEDPGAGDGRRWRDVPLQRRFPGPVPRQEKVDRRRGQRRAHLREPQLALVGAVLVEVQEHRIRDQQGILVAPRRRGRAQEQVLPRADRERREAGVDAVAVRVQQPPVVRGQRRDHRLRACSETVAAMVEIRVHRRRADQLRKLSGSQAPEEVHLEELLLRVNEAGRVREVSAVRRLDLGDPEVIAADLDGRREPGLGQGSVEPGPTAAQQQPAAQADREHHDQERERGAPQPSHVGAS